MITFVFLAAALTVVGVGLVAVPLLRRFPTETTPAPWAALGATGVMVIGSVVLYVLWSNWSWRAQSAADSPQTMVARLARKLEKDPQDLSGWLMLGRSYVVLEQYPLAVRAFERADRLAAGKSVEALVGEAEALALGDETELDRRAGRLVEQALALDPNSGKALFFGAAAAMRRGQLPLARERFAKLLTLDPPANVKPLLQQQIAAIDQQLGTAGHPAPSAATAAGGALGANSSPVAGTTAMNGPAGTRAASDSGAKVRINVTLAPSLSSSATSTSPLFVFVRDPERPGPPLAVKRLESHFPQTVELSAADSMLPGRAISIGQRVQVVARIARSGNPVGASGDPFGEIGYQVGHDGLINIVIDRVTP
jgi:cytochrome c-type biogenesis protein CcmH